MHMTLLLRARYALLLALSLLAMAVAAHDHDSPVAVVSDTRGRAYLVDHQGNVPLTVLRELHPGQVLRLERGSKVVVAFLPGGEVFELAGAGRFRVRSDTIEALDTNNLPVKRELPDSMLQLAAQLGAVMQALGIRGAPRGG
jgi:hypothetical protein